MTLSESSHRTYGGAALTIVLVFVILLAGLIIAYLSRTGTERVLGHGSVAAAQADQLARSALNLVIGDLKQEIADGSVPTTVANFTIYAPTSTANILPQTSGTPTNAPPIPNLVRRSVRSDAILPPGTSSQASACSSTSVSLNGRFITPARWNKHYLIPKSDPNNDKTDPVSSFTSPDWVIATRSGPQAFFAWDPSLQKTTSGNFALGRYAYAIYDEGGLLDANVAGYPHSLNASDVGRKGNLALADLTLIGIPNPNSEVPPVYQVDNIVGWRNFASARPGGDFALHFVFDATSGANYLNFIRSNTTGFLKTSGLTWKGSSGIGPEQTDQAFTSRQQLIRLQTDLRFSVSALQYLSTFSRELNAPTTGLTGPAPNPNFLQIRTLSEFTRFDGSIAVIGEPLVNRRFSLGRLAWLTFKGPSASLADSDPIIIQLLASGVSSQTIQSGTAENILGCFGLAYGGSPDAGWTYSHGVIDRILHLEEVAALGRDPDFFELLQATILEGSLGQSTGGGVTGDATVFPDVHMANKSHHVFSIGAAIIDQSDPDSIPTRIQFRPGGATWSAYGIESLPYMTQIYPISGISPADPAKWATYLLFQLWNPHAGAMPPLPPPQVRLRLDGDIGIFTGGNGQTYDPVTNRRIVTTGQSIALVPGAFPPGSTPAPLGRLTAASAPDVGTATPPCGFETLPPPASGTGITDYVGLRLLPDYALDGASPGSQRPQLTLYFGVDSSHRFNASLECDVGGGIWMAYNHFVGINDPASWINRDQASVRTAGNLSGTPNSGADQFNTSRLIQSPPTSLFKADPRSSRFGILQMTAATTSRITQSLWPSGQINGYGGTIADPDGPVVHAPVRFSGSGFPYYPATLCINSAPSMNSRTSYADNDGVIRPADSVYPDPSNNAIGASTPYYSTSTDYHPVVINRPLRSVGELGYAFRDLPWKSLDLFTDRSGDAGILDVFCIADEPNIVAGHINLNTRQIPVLQSVLAGAGWDDSNPGNTIFKTGGSATAAPVIATNIVAATSSIPLLNRSELVTRAGLPLAILPLPSGGTHNQTVKSRREVVARALGSVVQTRTWNLLIDLIAQSGRYPATATDLASFVVEGEKRYWLHVAIDRFTGEIIDELLEPVYE